MSLLAWSRSNVPPPESIPPVDPVQHAHALELLRAGVGDPTVTFRDDQWDVIDAVVNRRERVLLVQRTGWGKSAVYFISAKLLREQGRGPTIIVSPLIALMRNQVLAGKRMGLRIGALHAGTNDRFDQFVQLVEDDRVDVLLVSPERFANPRFVDELLPLLMARIGLLVVDEAHCISDWGHDFRPDYQRLANLIGQLPPNSPLLATTATANDRVVADVGAQLGQVWISRGPLSRENLALQAMPTMSGVERLAWLAQVIPILPGKGIVYTLTQHDAERVAGWLVTRGVDAHAYHAGIVTAQEADAGEVKKALEERFTSGSLKVLVATTALGMGYDNPDVRFVIHYQSPGSIIAYYQQVGRAGRGRDGAVGILMSGPEDGEIHESFRTGSLPTAADIVQILTALEKVDGATSTRLMAAVNIPKGRLENGLRYLSVQRPAMVLREGSVWRRTPVAWRPDYVEHRDALIALREVEWEELQAYRRQKSGCRMQTLLQALDDPGPPARCGICDLCRGKPVIAVEPDPDLLHEAYRFAGRIASNVILPRRMIPKDALADPALSSRIKPELLAEPGRTLGRWGDDSWGDRTAAGKAAGRFDDGVLAEAASFIRETWQPKPPPAWVTSVPSLRHPDLVPDFARTLAAKLGLPYRDVLVKVRDTDEQKLQANSVHQVRNLVDAFAVTSPPDAGPVLLVDDLVDSGWTFTILAMLLREAGSGPVQPFALATTRPRDDA